MVCKYLWLGVLCSLLIGVVFGYDGAYIDTKEIDFGPTLNIFNGLKKEVDISMDISLQEELVFKLTITNSKGYWVCWDNLKYNLKIKHEGDEQSYDLTQTLDGKTCLPPNEETNIWIPFETYNKLEEQKRLGHWTITPSVSLEGVSCFFSKDITKDICGSERYGKRASSFSGNVKKFNVVKKEPTTHTTVEEIKNWLSVGYNLLIALGAGAFAIVAILKFLNYGKKGRKKRK